LHKNKNTETFREPLSNVSNVTQCMMELTESRLYSIQLWLNSTLQHCFHTTL